MTHSNRYKCKYMIVAISIQQTIHSQTITSHLPRTLFAAHPIVRDLRAHVRQSVSQLVTQSIAQEAICVYMLIKIAIII